jgi:hypothetical protein
VDEEGDRQRDRRKECRGRSEIAGGRIVEAQPRKSEEDDAEVSEVRGRVGEVRADEDERVAEIGCQIKGVGREEAEVAAGAAVDVVKKVGKDEEELAEVGQLKGWRRESAISEMRGKQRGESQASANGRGGGGVTEKNGVHPHDGIGQRNERM